MARFLFMTEDLDKSISSLSGGERGRLSLLKLTLEKGNFLIMDEPTNHLDIQSREIMEDYLADFPGTLLIVSHDRYFLDTLADRVLDLTTDELISHTGNYSDYREWKERTERLERRDKEETKSVSPKIQGVQRTNSGSGESEDKPARPLDRFAKAKLRRSLQELEIEIATLEKEEAAIVEALSDPGMYDKNESFDFLKGLNDRLSNIQRRLPEAYREWEETGKRLEEA